MQLVWHGDCNSTLMSDVKCAIDDSERQLDKLAQASMVGFVHLQGTMHKRCIQPYQRRLVV